MQDAMIRGDGVVLHTFRVDDADDLAAGCNDAVTQQFLHQLPNPYTREDALWWINEGAPAAFASGASAYATADPTTDRVLGGAGLRPQQTDVVEIGYWTAPWARGRGVATAAARTLAQHAFDAGIQRVTLRTQPENSASQRVAIAAGFRREGLERAATRGRDGRRLDTFRWARLASDPPGPSPRLLPDLPGHGLGGDGELSDGVVTLRPLGPADNADCLVLRNLPDVVASSVPPEPPEPDKVARMCTRSQASWLAGERADLTIRDAATGAYAGEIGLFYWEPPSQQAMIGYSMLPQWRGRGYAGRAVRLLAAWAFESAGIARLVAGTAPENTASQRVLEAAGFQREGYQRARLPGVDNQRIDDILYALLP